MQCFPVPQLVLLTLVLYFLVRGIMGFLRAGYAYLLSAWRLLGVCKLALAASVCGLHLSRCAMAKQQWAAFLKHPRDAFTDFYPLARQSQIYIVTSALLLFVLVLKVKVIWRQTRWNISLNPLDSSLPKSPYEAFVKGREKG